MKHFTLFNVKRQAQVFIPSGTLGFACITRSIRSRVQIKLLSLKGVLSVRENWPVVLMNFSFSCECDLHDRRQI